MEAQFQKMQNTLNVSAKACEAGFPDDKDLAAACTAKVRPRPTQGTRFVQATKAAQKVVT